MTTRRFIGLSLGLTLGIVVASLFSHLPTALLAAGLLIGLLLSALAIRAERRWCPWSSVVVFAAAALLAFPVGYWRTLTVIGAPQEGSLRQHLHDLTDGARIQLHGTVSREPEFRSDGQLDLQIRTTGIRIGSPTNTAWLPVSGGEALVRVFIRTGDATETQEHFNQLALSQTYGYRVELTVTYRPMRIALNPAEFDYARFLQQNGADISLRCHARRIAILAPTRGNPLMELALAAKADFLKTFKLTIRAPASRLAAAATLGTRRAVEKTEFRGMDIAQMFRHAGVGHVLAVSGLHVSVIAVMLFAIFRLTGASPRLFVPPLIFFLLLFALLTGARPSSMRAVMMNSSILVAIAYYRSDIRSATLVGLSLSALLILLASPMVLFAPSFLLSYGAVLSLIVLGPPMERALYALRGFSLAGFIIWFALLVGIGSGAFHLLCQPLNITALGGLLWMLITVGSLLNHRYPKMWSIGMEKVPPVIRMFLAAQLAIQIGMMIPLSAWFFGRFPVAGIFVNLLAIPAIGILVQLGMMTGLVGLIPVAGIWLAMPLGVAATLVGDAFMLLAYAGARTFPFPPVPRPTPCWMLAYFGILVLLIFLEQRRTFIMDVIYRFAPADKNRAGRSTTLALVLPALLMALPLLRTFSGQPSVRHVDILAAGRYPLVTLTGGGCAIVINAGDRFDGERLMFESIRARGATRIEALMLPSPDPLAGIQGATALLSTLQIQTILLPVLPSQGQRLTDAIGDRYLIEQAAEGNARAVIYDQAFDALRQEALLHGTDMACIGDTTPTPWKNVTITTLPRLSEPPSRFAASAIAPILQLSIHGRSWVIITDTTPESLAQSLADAAPCDILVVPNLSSYANWLRTALKALQPKLLIIGGDTPVAEDKLKQAIRDTEKVTVFQTGHDGAVSATLLPNGTTRLSTHLSRKIFVLDAPR